MTDQLTHFNDQNRAKMVDVTDKAVTHRVATATGQITMHPATLQRIHDGQIKKATSWPSLRSPVSWRLNKRAV